MTGDSNKISAELIEQVKLLSVENKRYRQCLDSFNEILAELSGKVEETTSLKTENQELRQQIEALRSQNQDLQTAFVNLSKEMNSRSFGAVSSDGTLNEYESDSEPPTIVVQSDSNDNDVFEQVSSNGNQAPREVDALLGMSESGADESSAKTTLTLTIEHRKTGRVVASSEIDSGGTFRIGRLRENCTPESFAKFLEKDGVLSGRHMTIRFNDTSVTVRDENSRNGTTVDDVEVRGSIEKSLEDLAKPICIQAGQEFNFRLALEQHGSSAFPKSSVVDLEQSDFDMLVVSASIDEDYLDNLFD